MKISDKDTFKRLQAEGLLGNYFRTFSAEDGFGNYDGWLTVRARRASDRALFIPTVHTEAFTRGCCQHRGYAVMREPTADCNVCRALWIVKHHSPDVYLQECPAPDSRRIINLEAMPGYAKGLSKAADAQLHVRYAVNDPTNLRHSLEQNGVDAVGLRALEVLRFYLQEDLDQLHAIWNEYPGAVIEASRFTQRVGVFGSQTIIWEVRHF